MRTVSVVGLGYIGLPTAAFFADSDFEVIGVDINPTYVETINSGKVPFSEPGFDDLLSKVVENGSLRASVDVESAEAYIIAVPTPFREEYQVDDSFIMAAAENVSGVLKGGKSLYWNLHLLPALLERWQSMF